MCRWAEVSRAGFYRYFKRQQPREEEQQVRAAIQQVVIENRNRYGYRRVTRELRYRGMVVNHKRVARIMKKDNLLAVQRRAFVLTTEPNHEFEVYMNLAKRMKLTGINQLWVADITYIELGREFVYLAIILDAFSRMVVGWALERTLSTRLCIAALEKALAARKPPAGLVHHSDRGVQYASKAYIDLLRANQMQPSMSRPANPYDNASCESFMRTVKREEIHAHRYRDLEHLRASIAIFIDQYYNCQRLHSALGYRSPEQFEQQLDPATSSAAAKMSFFRHEESSRSDGKPTEIGSPTHRLDESPTGYSLEGCSPAEPSSASPAGHNPLAR
jgi:transposase InsO family protein